MSAWSRDHEGPPACAERPTLRPPQAAPPKPSEPAPPRQQGSPRWLSPPTLPGEAEGPSTLSQAFEGSCTAPATHNASGHLLVPPGRWPSATLCNRRLSFYLSDGAKWRPPALPGRRRLRCSASGPMSFGDLPSPGLGPLATAPPLPLIRLTFSDRRAPATRDFAPTQGFKQNGAQIAELSMPASHPHDLHRLGSPRIGSCSGSSPFGAHPATADQACVPTPRHPSRAAVTRQGAALAASPQGLTASAADNSTRSAGRVAHLASADLHPTTGAPRPADLGACALTASSLATAPGAIAPVASLAAHTPPPTHGLVSWAVGSGGEATTPAGAPT